MRSQNYINLPIHLRRQGEPARKNVGMCHRSDSPQHLHAQRTTPRAVTDPAPESTPRSYGSLALSQAEYPDTAGSAQCTTPRVVTRRRSLRVQATRSSADPSRLRYIDDRQGGVLIEHLVGVQGSENTRWNGSEAEASSFTIVRENVPQNSPSAVRGHAVCYIRCREKQPDRARHGVEHC